MAAESPVRNSEGEGENAQGLLFRLSLRAGAIVFLAVLGISIYGGLSPSLALIRAMVALIAFGAFGWLAEQIAQKAWQEQLEPESLVAAGDEAGDTSEL